MRTYSTTGIVLHRTLLGEADKIITVYTRESGKISAIAKGSRKPGSQLSGATELFTSARFMMSKGRSLDVVSQCEIIQSYPALRMNLNLLARATYMCELLDRVTHDHDATAAETLYDLTAAALFLLQRAEASMDCVLHAFELHILAEVGYAPELEACTRCGKAVGIASTAFSPSQGGVLCADDRYAVRDSMAISAEALKVMTELRDANPESVLNFGPSARVLLELDMIIRAYIVHRLDRPLKSAEFLDQIRQSS